MTVLDELIYRNYAFNRKRSPGIPPKRWMKIFGEAATQMEKRFSKEEK